MDIITLVATISEWLGVIAVTMILRASPRFQPRKLDFLYPRREGMVSLTLFALILIIAFFFYQSTLHSSVSAPSGVLDLLWQQLTLALISLAAFVAALFIRKQPALSVLWGRPLLGSSIRLGLALVFLTIFLRGMINTLLKGVSATQGYALLGCLGVSLAEETIFRGYLQPRLGAWLGSRRGWLAASAMFALWQIPRLMSDPVTLPLKLVLVTIQGLILGWATQKSGHVLGPALYRTVSMWTEYLV